MQRDFESNSNTMPGGARAIVIGGGVIGLSTALALQARGTHTTLFDAPSATPPASWGNAGHISVEQVEPRPSLAVVRGMPKGMFWRGGGL